MGREIKIRSKEEIKMEKKYGGQLRNVYRGVCIAKKKLREASTKRVEMEIKD